MKGLVLNNFYAMQNNIKISFVISLLLAIVSVGLKEPKLISMVIAAQIFVIMGNIATTMHVDEASKWNKMEITLPVKRRDIVTAKYVSFMLLVLLGISFSLPTLLILEISGSEMNAVMLLDGYSFGLSITINTIAILYPLILKFGAKESETMLMLAVGAAIGVRFAVWGVLIQSISIKIRTFRVHTKSKAST
ncbi:MAG: ABC-2 transporter permease [Niameybacter sp.]